MSWTTEPAAQKCIRMKMAFSICSKKKAVLGKETKRITRFKDF
jgi:hypothetical protein